MKRQVSRLCIALLMLPSGSVLAGDTRDPRTYDAPAVSSPLGRYVRVNDGQAWQYGTLSGAYRDSLILRQVSPDGNELILVIPQKSIHEIQVCSGRRGHQSWGALLGGIAGLVGGMAVGAELAEDNEPSGSDFFSLPGELFAGGLIGLLLGAGVGGLIGSAVTTDDWRDVDIDRLPVGVKPRATSRPKLGITLQF